MESAGTRLRVLGVVPVGQKPNHEYTKNEKPEGQIRGGGNLHKLLYSRYAASDNGQIIFPFVKGVSNA